MVPPPLQTREKPYGDPATRNGKPYQQTTRDQIQHLLETGQLTKGRILQLKQTQKLPSWRTCKRWKKIYQELGHMRPCRHTGNRQIRALSGHRLIQLSLYKLFLPKSTYAETNAFLFNANQHDPNNRFFSNSQLCRANKTIHLTRKRASTTAEQASHPVNIMKRDRYYSMPYPFGIADIPAEDQIDVDEFGACLEGVNRSTGLSHPEQCVSEEGHYHDLEKLNNLMAISGEAGTAETPSRRWRDMWKGEGTTEIRFYNFIRSILDDLPHGDEGRRYCFTMDNLAAHHSPIVSALIYERGHRLAFRAPYYPVDGPIEYVFNTIQAELRIRLHNINNENDLIREIGRAVFLQTNFQPYFRHCGMWR